MLVWIVDAFYAIREPEAAEMAECFTPFRLQTKLTHTRHPGKVPSLAGGTIAGFSPQHLQSATRSGRRSGKNRHASLQ